MKKPKKKHELKGEGFLEPLGDAMEAHPDFQDEYLDMAHRHIKKTNPELHAVMERVKAKGGSK